METGRGPAFAVASSAIALSLSAGCAHGAHGASADAGHDETGANKKLDASLGDDDSGEDLACLNPMNTSISGKVFDPAGKNALYNIWVYVPKTKLTPLPRGVPTGANACSCGALYPSGSIASTTTASDGSFILRGVPSGSAVPLVLQIGKWRRFITLNVNPCVDNPQADPTLFLPPAVIDGETDNSIPDIAVSTGSADTLECLLLRMGLDPAEYVAGNGTTGHIHIFSGGSSTAVEPDAGINGIGQPESFADPAAPRSSVALWASAQQLMNFDLVLLSCEGGETYNANPAALETYLNAGGRAFASHYHYAWFSGPIGSGQAYTAPPDWGSHLATWNEDLAPGTAGEEIGTQIVTSLNATGKPFAKGQAMLSWLDQVGALGQNGAAGNELSVFDPRYNATVGPMNTASQPWIIGDTVSGHAGAAMYFSFDTPINGVPAADGGSQYCGRAVFSDLHVSGDPSEHDGSPPPGACTQTDLSPQEKALEFMLFDLSSCVVSDQLPPFDAGFPK
jgi:hypothetical protein